MQKNLICIILISLIITYNNILYDTQYYIDSLFQMLDANVLFPPPPQKKISWAHRYATA